ncbi:MAG: TetM/TetW/TetO/TetS family tetracycline resistance ribosomal protection protein, partial [Chloroflexia bacterium]|nr:TetM/TetW/TetO/TetS family tetracycline resistance ribosomal protection protein [Chloroflexia bacterium]
RAVHAAGLPLLIFANKIDRIGARSDDLLVEIERLLPIRLLAMSTVTGIGARSASVELRDSRDAAFATALINVLAEHNDGIIARFLIGGRAIPVESLRRELARQVHAGQVVPVFFGAAITGAGVRDLLGAVPALLGMTCNRAGEPLSGMIFKIQRSPAGEKIALVRLFAGTLKTRQHVPLCRRAADGELEISEARITGIEIFRDGSTSGVAEAVAGDIVRLHGIGDARIGDILGAPPDSANVPRFAPPTLESVIRPRACADASRLNAALDGLAEADPLIGIRRSARDGSISVRLYGEVQKEVIQATLEREYGVAVEFAPSRVLCIERVTGTGDALEEMGAGNPFAATVGLRFEPAPPGSGIAYHRELGALPLAFYRAIEETVHETLEEGLHGWPVRDCVVTVTRVAFSAPVSTAGDFRKLTPLVLMEALKRAGTVVCEPVSRFTFDLPLDAAGEGYSALANARAIPEATEAIGATSRITGTIPSAELHHFERVLPGIANGLAVFTTEGAGYRAISGDPPTRPRTDFDPLNRKLYLALVSQS